MEACLKTALMEDEEIFFRSTEECFLNRDLSPNTKESFGRWFKNQLQRGNVRLQIIERNGEAVGCIKIEKVCEISIAKLPEHRRKGYAQEILKKVISDSEEPLIALIDKDNSISKDLFEKSGFKKEPGNHELFRL